MTEVKYSLGGWIEWEVETQEDREAELRRLRQNARELGMFDVVRRPGEPLYSLGLDDLSFAAGEDILRRIQALQKAPLRRRFKRINLF